VDERNGAAYTPGVDAAVIDGDTIAQRAFRTSFRSNRALTAIASTLLSAIRRAVCCSSPQLGHRMSEAAVIRNRQFSVETIGTLPI